MPRFCKKAERKGESMRRIVRAILPTLARLHPKNCPNRENIRAAYRTTGLSGAELETAVEETVERERQYPQLFNVWPSWTSRRNPRIYRLRTVLCGFLTGHELSETEWGYGGGNLVDRNCRWCDLLIQIPKREEIVPEVLRGLVEPLGYYSQLPPPIVFYHDCAVHGKNLPFPRS